MGGSRGRWLLAVTLLGSLAALVLVSWWLLREPGVAKAEALKTGGLAGGAILALYALWINDRRRRTEEARHEVERGRAELDRDRVADERFAKAVELLGNEADQVRVGALHVLAGLARTRPEYTQTVLDVLCAYLRRPFEHPAYALRPDNPDQAEADTDERFATADRERQVRLTAQRLIGELLPGTEVADAPRYDLDLTSASLAYLELAGRQVGALTARRAHLYGITRMRGFRAHGVVLFSGAVFHGRTDLTDAEFRDGLSLLDARIVGEWRVDGAGVWRFVHLTAAAPPRQVGALTVVEGAQVKPRDIDTGWALRAPDTPKLDTPEQVRKS